MKIQKICVQAVGGILALSLGFGLAGCGAQNEEQAPVEQESTTEEEQPSKVETPAAQEAPKKQTLGTKTEKSVEVKLRNALEKPIESLQLRPAGSEQFEENLLAAGSVITAGDEAVLYVTPVEGVTEYDMSLRVQGDEEDSVILSVPLPSLKSVAIKQVDGEIIADYARGSSESDDAQSNASSFSDDSTGSADYQADAQGSSNNGYENYDDGGASYAESVAVEAPVVDEAPAEAAVVVESAPEQSSDACQGDVVLRD